MSASPRPADACPFPDRALANVLLLRVVVIYILSVYINLSAAALAALLQSACLLGSLGDFPPPPARGLQGELGRQVPAPCEQQQTPPKEEPRRLVPTQDAERCARPGVGGREGTAGAGQRQAARGWK